MVLSCDKTKLKMIYGLILVADHLSFSAERQTSLMFFQFPRSLPIDKGVTHIN